MRPFFFKGQYRSMSMQGCLWFMRFLYFMLVIVTATKKRSSWFQVTIESADARATAAANGPNWVKSWAPRGSVSTLMKKMCNADRRGRPRGWEAAGDLFTLIIKRELGRA